jgi:hypothetical protein
MGDDAGKHKTASASCSSSSNVMVGILLLESLVLFASCGRHPAVKFPHAVHAMVSILHSTFSLAKVCCCFVSCARDAHN